MTNNQMKYLYIAILSTISLGIYAQSPCVTHKSVSGLMSVTPEDVICIAKESDKDISLFYTFAEWCSPCRKNMPKIIDLAKKNDIALYFLIISRETFFDEIDIAVDFIKEKIEEPNIYIISDSLYSKKNAVRKRSWIVLVGAKEREKYTNFLKKITPPSFEVIDDIGKSILINKEGEVILITSYKDVGKKKKRGEEAVYKKIEEYIAKQRAK